MMSFVVGMSRKPRISIIIPCYNGAAYLRQAIDSAVKQTVRPYEVIIVDDGSTDDSAEIAKSYGKPVRVVTQQNQGESAARNQGILASYGDYLLFLDADDLLDPEALRVLSDGVSRDASSVVLMGCAWFENDPANPIAVKTPEYKSFFPHIIQGNLCPIHCWLVPRELVIRVGRFNRSIQQFEDWDLWCQIALTGAPLVSLSFVGAYYRRHKQCQSETSPSIERCRGHVAVLRRLSDGMIHNHYLMRRYGMTLFWSAWTALHRGRRSGMKWKELERLGENLAELAKKGPEEVTSLRFAKLIRMFGVRWAERIRDIYWNDSDENRPPERLPNDVVAMHA